MSEITEQQLNPAKVAEQYVNAVKREASSIDQTINVVGLIASEDKPSLAYGRATKQKFDDVGIHYDLRSVTRLDLESLIHELNEDTTVHGIFIYFPVFNNQQDDYLRNLVDFRKDIEAGSSYWTRKLYANDRFAVENGKDKKALLPCTPLAIIKMLTEVNVYDMSRQKPIAGKVVTIFNRSEVIGRPLAVMMSNDGATVYSFDENGPLKFVHAQPSETDITRSEALAQSDIVVTGVPNKEFMKISCKEIRQGTTCINFSSTPNFFDDVNTHTDIYIPKVGPMTVAMCMRNTLRLFTNFHQGTA
ncbi:MAG: bifunctional methylenetetrahydrofolate dehydrogenase/methenyltetrahydrofolate cyclohydrolase [bacterium]|nr:bifunctional methylenetetrahydrofolate dehydrogenase/methenyltetrahydrofolate cyclohydrolase [Gammaproteobacteria bacterium]HIL95797.1 bifunctional methylenetetrahydrofolate dehydrogenase/methenyltetrahydrofolate cyclohydrolase [Pseudomonadales bacterium]